MKRTWMVGTPLPDTFPLPHEVFELGLEQGALLVYIYLVYHKSRKHRTRELSCATISGAVGLCKKTVRRHLHTLIDKGLVQIAGRDSSFSYALCPIWDKVRGSNLPTQYKGGQLA